MVKPERVLIYTKKMEVRWRALEEGLQGVRSLDDIIRIDLDFLCRHATPLAHSFPELRMQICLMLGRACFLFCMRNPHSKAPHAHWSQILESKLV